MQGEIEKYTTKTQHRTQIWTILSYLNYICRAFCQTTANYILFSGTPRAFIDTDHIQGHKAHHNRFKS